MKLDLIIDGNYFLYRNVFILKNNKNIKNDLLEYMLDDLRKVARSFNFNRIFVTGDSPNPWRKDMYPDYKGKREKDESIDWKLVYTIFDEFKDTVVKFANIKMLQAPRVEGDDFIAHCVRSSNADGISCLIIASDIDITQLLTKDINRGVINVQWNFKISDEKVYAPENHQLVIEKNNVTVDDFLFNDNTGNDVCSFLNTFMDSRAIIPVSKEATLFKKIVWGDTGDNILSPIKLKAGKIDPDGTGIGEKGAVTSYQYYKEMFPGDIQFSTDEFVDNLTVIIKYYKKIKHDEFDDHIKKNIKLNISLMELDDRHIPADILDAIKTTYNSEVARIVSNPVPLLKPREKSDTSVPDSVKIVESHNISPIDDFFDL